MIGQHIWLTGSGAAGAVQVLTSQADIHTFTIVEKCSVIQAGFLVGTIVASSVSAVVEFDRVPKHAGVREAAFASLTIPTGTVVGDIYYDVPATIKTLYPGDTVVVQVATASTSTGGGYPYLVVEPIPERPANVTGMHESA
jgi:hypothetical protein